MPREDGHPGPVGSVLRRPFHPFLFGLFPILALFARNIDIIPWTSIVRPAWVVLLAIAILNLLFLLFFRNWTKAALLASLFVVPFFAIGYVSSAIGSYHADVPEIVEAEQTLKPAIGLYIGWLAALIGCGILLFNTTRALRRTTALVNVIAVALILMPAARIIAHEIRPAGPEMVFEGDDDDEGATARPVNAPDIYYIMLDGYGRSDVLRYLFDYDNSDFIAFLKEKGFYVAEQSCSNYIQSIQSLTATLNFTYLGTMLKDVPPGERKRDVWLDRLFQENRVVRYLKKRGYRYVAFDSGFWSPEDHHPDVILRPGRGFSAFENELINATPLSDLLTALPVEDQHDQHRQRILYQLDHLADATELQGPLFVFAHIFAGHAPFVLNHYGEAIRPNRRFSYGFKGSSREYEPGYRGQVAFISKKLKTTITDILARSERPPAIIMHGDHGSRMLMGWKGADNARFSESFPILNSYYLPGVKDAPLYESISPVNTFRVVFNGYFGSNYKLLRDRCFYSTRDKRDKFREIDRDTIAPSKDLFRYARSMPVDAR